MAISNRAPGHNRVVAVKLEGDLDACGDLTLLIAEKRRLRKGTKCRCCRSNRENDSTSPPGICSYSFLRSAYCFHVASVHECSWRGRVWAWEAEPSMQWV